LYDESDHLKGCFFRKQKEKNKTKRFTTKSTKEVTKEEKE